MSTDIGYPLFYAISLTKDSFFMLISKTDQMMPAGRFGRLAEIG